MAQTKHSEWISSDRSTSGNRRHGKQAAASHFLQVRYIARTLGFIIHSFAKVLGELPRPRSLGSVRRKDQIVMPDAA
jgi:hypothetical protein